MFKMEIVQQNNLNKTTGIYSKIFLLKNIQAWPDQCAHAFEGNFPCCYTTQLGIFFALNSEITRRPSGRRQKSRKILSVSRVLC